MIELKKKITLSLCLTCLGLIILFLSKSYFSKIFIPGPISAQHSSFSDDCLKCHDRDLNKIKFSLTHSGDNKCITCHKLGSTQDLPHGIKIFSNERKTNCIECHTEHKGSAKIDFDNDKCQACHKNKFSKFEKGHPKFSNYPYLRRTRIIFEHQSHSRKYNKDSNCLSCHQVDNKGEHIQTLDFKTSCSSCHLKDINGEGQLEAGFAFLTIPELDKNKLELSSWPDKTEANLTAFMKVILSSDAKISKHLFEIEKLDLTNLEDASQEQKESVKIVINALKGFYLELYTQGHAALRKRLENIPGAEINNLISGFPLSMFRKAIKDWLPNSIKQDSQSNSEELSPEELMQSGGWYRNSYTIFYRPRGHADVFTKAWMDLKDNIYLKQQIFNKNSPGKCAMCHSVDNNTTVNWNSNKNTNQKKLTKFKHQNHFLVMKNQGCTTCHSLDPQSANNYLQSDPFKFSSNFLDIDKQICSECHIEDKARNNCLECHNYHSY